MTGLAAGSGYMYTSNVRVASRKAPVEAMVAVMVVLPAACTMAVAPNPKSSSSGLVKRSERLGTLAGEMVSTLGFDDVKVTSPIEFVST